jgi:hypothetical protein
MTPRGNEDTMDTDRSEPKPEWASHLRPGNASVAALAAFAPTLINTTAVASGLDRDRAAATVVAVLAELVEFKKRYDPDTGRLVAEGGLFGSEMRGLIGAVGEAASRG